MVSWERSETANEWSARFTQIRGHKPINSDRFEAIPIGATVGLESTRGTAVQMLYSFKGGASAFLCGQCSLSWHLGVVRVGQGQAYAFLHVKVAHKYFCVASVSYRCISARCGWGRARLMLFFI